MIGTGLAYKLKSSRMHLSWTDMGGEVSEVSIISTSTVFPDAAMLIAVSATRQGIERIQHRAMWSVAVC